MVKRALLACLVTAQAAYGAVYQINIVKEKKPKEEKPSSFIIYKVKPGDTLSEILKMFNIPLRLLYEVARLNHIKNPNVIYVGQKIKLPGESPAPKRQKGNLSEGEVLSILKRFGAKVEQRGYLFVGGYRVPLSRYPKVTVNQSSFILDFDNSLKPKVKSELRQIGFSVLGGSNISQAVKAALSKNFAELQENGTLILGVKDLLTYHYDFMGIDRFSGLRTVINLKADTPPPLERLLNAYDIALVQPKWKKLDTKEGNGKLKILTGEGIEKLAALVKLVSGEKGEVTDKGLKLPKSQVYVVYDFVTPEERVKLQLQGFKVVVLSGNFLKDSQRILSLIPVANKPVKLVLYEPPGTKGKRSTFEIEGLLISAPKRDWFMVDSVDKSEEIPYLRYRGVNLIIY